jgi:hypothetical protein
MRLLEYVLQRPVQETMVESNSIKLLRHFDTDQEYQHEVARVLFEGVSFTVG